MVLSGRGGVFVMCSENKNAFYVLWKILFACFVN